jgi:hypothetical protein
VPAVGLEALGDVLSEGALGVTVWLKSALVKFCLIARECLPMEMWLSS